MPRIALYAAALALGTFALQWLDYKRLARAYSLDITLFVIAAAFLALGIWLGTRLLSAKPLPHDGNPRAQAALGISARELTVLHSLSAGHSNKEIAAQLGVSPNTVKTHVARLFEKLDARRRTDAIAKARELGIVP